MGQPCQPCIARQLAYAAVLTCGAALSCADTNLRRQPILHIAMPTSARARASCPAPDQVLDALPVTLSLLPKSYLAEIMTAKNGAPGFRAFVLIGVAAAFCAPPSPRT